MRRFSLMTGILLLVSLSLFAQVNEDELEQNQAPITFFNYEGPQARIETREQIRNIGYALGQVIRGGAGRGGTLNRYFVIHVVGPAEGSKLDADIFGLGYDIGVDHIRNLRLIIQGYLEAAYAYSARDAALLASYITVYNAVYRGDWEYITDRYKGPVIDELDPARTGLSIRFDEWPGRTLLLIPLGLPNSLSAVDTGVVSDPRVIEELRKDEDMGIEQRRDMVDLKEREADEAELRAEERRQEAAEEQRRIDEERQQVVEERRQIVEEQREREQAAGEPGQTAEELRPGQPAAEPETPEDREARDEELARRDEALAGQEEELDRRQAAVDEQQEEAQRDQDLAEQRREEARQEREDIARDQQVLLNEEPRKESGPGLISAVIESQSSPLGRMVRVDSTTGEELGRSDLNTVNTRTIYNVNGRYFAIAGENRGGGAIRLVEIDSETLEMKTQGADNIHPQSLLWVSGADLYAVTVLGDVPYLGRFNYQLTRLARSAVAVHPFATVLFQDGFLLTQRQDGSALILDPGTLEEPSYPAN